MLYILDNWFVQRKTKKLFSFYLRIYKDFKIYIFLGKILQFRPSINLSLGHI